MKVVTDQRLKDSCVQGNKPDFHLAMGGEGSKALYSQVLLEAGKLMQLM